MKNLLCGWYWHACIATFKRRSRSAVLFVPRIPELLWSNNDLHGDWKVVRQNPKNEKEPTLELYNLKDNATESRNLIDLYPEILEMTSEILKNEREIPELEHSEISLLKKGLLAEKSNLDHVKSK